MAIKGIEGTMQEVHCIHERIRLKEVSTSSILRDY